MAVEVRRRDRNLLPSHGLVGVFPHTVHHHVVAAPRPSRPGREEARGEHEDREPDHEAQTSKRARSHRMPRKVRARAARPGVPNATTPDWAQHRPRQIGGSPAAGAVRGSLRRRRS